MLARAPVSKKHLLQTLAGLPQSLDETYERILLSIDDVFQGDARRILMMICFAPRPLTAFELIDAVAVDLSSRPGLVQAARLGDADDLLAICPCLLHVIEDVRGVLESGETSSSPGTFRLSHYSIMEYLECDRLGSRARYFGMQAGASHAEIAHICLLYLLDPALSNPDLHSVFLDMPLAQYAAQYWHHHYKHADTPSTELNDLVRELFDSQVPSFRNWVRLHNIDAQYKLGDKDDNDNYDENPARTDLNLNASAIASPLYYGSFLGLGCVISDYSDETHRDGGMSRVEDQKAIESPLRHQVDREEGNCGNALYAASYGGHPICVLHLIGMGFDINKVIGQFGSPLVAASFKGHARVVKLLLENGADVNLIAGEYGTPIQAASAKGLDEVFDMLVKSNADPFLKCGRYHSTLQAACYGGNGHIVHELLDLGLDVNESGGRYGNALQAASARGHEQILHLLLEAKPDVNVCGGACGTPLIAASGSGVVPVVLQLLHVGANVTTSTDTGWTALHEAAKNGHAEVIQVLLNWGARIDAVDVNHSTAIHEAVSHECWSAQDLLIAQGASIDIKNHTNQTVIDLAWSKKQLDWAAYSLDKNFTQQIKQGRQAQCEVLRRQVNSMKIPEVRFHYPFTMSIDLPSQLVFCKRFALAGSTGQKVRKYLLREHAILQKLDHPYVISYLGYHEDKVDGSAAIYLEFCDGQDLRKHVPEDNEDDDSVEEDISNKETPFHTPTHSTVIPLQENEVWHYIFQLSAAIAYLHHGLSIRKDDQWCFEARWDPVIHRDIKPANGKYPHKQLLYRTSKYHP